MKLINPQYTEYLYSQLSNFYREYMYDENFYRILLDAFTDAAFYIKNAADSVVNNTTLNSAEIAHNETLFKVKLNDALYDVSNLKVNFKLATGYDWESDATPINVKINYLDNLGHFNYLINNINSEPLANLIDIRLQQDYSTELPPYTRGKDYFIKDSKIFAFNNLAKPVLHGGTDKNVLGRDLTTYNNVLSDRWGIFIPEVKNNYLEGFEYKEFFQAIVNFTPTIANMRKAVSALSFGTLSDQAMFRDKYSKKNISIDQFKSAANIGAFEFVYKVPPEYTALSGLSIEDVPTNSLDVYTRITNITNFLKAMKPAHTRFFISTGINVQDSVTITDSVTLTLNPKTPAIYGLARCGITTYADVL